MKPDRARLPDDRPRAHPVAAVFPMLDDDALAALAHDIATNGLIEPVVVNEGLILDGRNRLRACEIADVEPEFRDWEGEAGEIPAWIISKNLHRRHLDTSQRAMIAALLEGLGHGGNRVNRPAGVLNRAEAAAALNVGERSVARAAEVLAAGDPDVIDRIRRGEETVGHAVSQLRGRDAPPRGTDDASSLTASVVEDLPDTSPPAADKFDAMHAHLGPRTEDPITPLPARIFDRDDAEPRTAYQRGLDQLDAEAARAPSNEPAAPTPVSESPNYDSDSWSTPDDLIAAAREVLGEIDLDPATNAGAQARIRAATHYTKDDDGLKQRWSGRTWLNPPYSSPLCGLFVARLVAYHDAGDVPAALLLVNNATDARWFQALLERFPVCFLAGRTKFLYEGGTRQGARQGQAVFYLGPDRAAFLRVFGEHGVILEAA